MGRNRKGGGAVRCGTGRLRCAKWKTPPTAICNDATHAETFYTQLSTQNVKVITGQSTHALPYFCPPSAFTRLHEADYLVTRAQNILVRLVTPGNMCAPPHPTLPLPLPHHSPGLIKLPPVNVAAANGVPYGPMACRGREGALDVWVMKVRPPYLVQV